VRARAHRANLVVAAQQIRRLRVGRRLDDSTIRRESRSSRSIQERDSYENIYGGFIARVAALLDRSIDSFLFSACGTLVAGLVAKQRCGYRFIVSTGKTEREKEKERERERGGGYTRVDCTRGLARLHVRPVRNAVALLFPPRCRSPTSDRLI